MNPTIHLSFRYQERDLARAARAHYGSRRRLCLDLCVVVLLAMLGAYFWSLPGTHWRGVVSVTITVVFVLVLATVLLIVPRWTLCSNPKFRDDDSLTFSAEGIHFRTAHIDSRLSWSIYVRVLVDAHSYLFYYGFGQYTVILSEPSRVPRINRHLNSCSRGRAYGS